jgi:hypothetical protein
VLPEVTLPEVTPHPIKALDQKDRVMRRKTIKFFKIQWSNYSEEEATWERDDFLRSRHPDFELCICSLFLLEPLLLPNIGTRFLLGGEL